MFLNREGSPMRLLRILLEFRRGFHFIRQYEKAVSFFGSARDGFDRRFYGEAERLAAMLAREDFAVITGGGPGMMEAANRGAYNAGGRSVGINIDLPHGQRTNPFVIESQPFHYFFTRKVMLAFSSQVYVFMPGGFGTLDEFFEIITLVQTNKISPIPVILIGREYWGPLLKWMKEDLYKKNKAISKMDMDIYHLADNAEEAYELIRRLLEENNHKKAQNHNH